jgi:hypothetical protein
MTVAAHNPPPRDELVGAVADLIDAFRVRLFAANTSLPSAVSLVAILRCWASETGVTPTAVRDLVERLNSTESKERHHDP